MKKKEIINSLDKNIKSLKCFQDILLILGEMEEEINRHHNNVYITQSRRHGECVPFSDYDTLNRIVKNHLKQIVERMNKK